jgi:hypothetical protein
MLPSYKFEANEGERSKLKENVDSNIDVNKKKVSLLLPKLPFFLSS